LLPKIRPVAPASIDSRLLEHGLVLGVLTAGDQQQRPVGRLDHGRDGFLQAERAAVRLGDA
jgi:hypothetical protein